jgi:hypothetical protein
VALRTAHGNAAAGGALLVVETLPANELPEGTPGPARPEADRTDGGEFAPGPGTAAVAALGGKAKAEADKFRRLLGLIELPDDHAYQPYLRLAREHREDHGTDLAAYVGGGRLSPGVSSIVASASLALAASRYLYDEGAKLGSAKLLVQASRLADQSKASLLCAHELAAKEGASRRDSEGTDLEHRRRAFQAGLAKGESKP